MPSRFMPLQVSKLVTRSSALALGMRLISAALGYLIILLAARASDVSTFASFSLMLAIVGVFGPIGTLGQDARLLRHVGVLLQSDLGALKATLKEAASTTAVGLIGLAALGMAYASHVIHAPSVATLAILGALIVMNGAAELLFAAARATGVITPAIFAREIAWKSVLLLAIASAWATRRPLEIEFASIAYGLGLLVTLAVLLSRLTRIFRETWSAPTGASVGGRSGTAFFLLTFATQAAPQIDTLIVGAFFGATVEFGAFFASQRLIQLLYILPYGAAMTSAPRVPIDWEAGRVDEIIAASRRLSRRLGATVAMVAIVIAAFSSVILSLFKPEFAQFGYLLAVLTIAPTVSAFGGLYDQIPQLCGSERAYSRCRLAIFIISGAAKLLVASHGNILLYTVIVCLETASVTASGLIISRRLLGRWPI